MNSIYFDLGIIYNWQYEFQLFKSPEISHRADPHNLSIEKINADKHRAVNPMICSLCKQTYNNISMITLRCVIYLVII